MSVSSAHRIARAWAPLSRRAFTGALSASLIGVFLVAGWWPFHSPGNGVSWLPNGAGLRLHRPATLWSAEELARPGVVLRTIEIWLRPDRTDDNGTILAFGGLTSGHFYMNQSDSDLELQWNARGTKRNHVYIGDVFRAGRTVLITVVSGDGNVAVYIDGALKKRARRAFPFSDSAIAGRLVVGASPFSASEWGGQLRGLALSGRGYVPAEVRQRFLAWTNNGTPPPAEALYLFNEGAGSSIRDYGSLRWDLAIPPRFEVLHPTLLEPFWRDVGSRLNWGFWSDVLLNICGFLPFGFLLCAYLEESGRSRRAAVWATLFCGFFVSLTIESVQTLLPTRCSDSRDLLTNTLGTLFGIAACQIRPLRRVYGRCADLFLDIWNAAHRRFAPERAQSGAAEGSRVAAN